MVLNPSCSWLLFACPWARGAGYPITWPEVRLHVPPASSRYLTQMAVVSQKKAFNQDRKWKNSLCLCQKRRNNYSVPIPFPLSRQQVGWLSFSVYLCVAGRAYCTDERGGTGGGLGAESYDRENAWTSINHSILSPWGAHWVHSPLFWQSRA